VNRLLAVVVAAAVAWALAPAPADAGGARGGRPGHRSGLVQRIPSPPRSVFPQPVDPWKFWPPSPGLERHGSGLRGSGAPFVTFGTTPSVIVNAPVVVETYTAPSAVLVPPVHQPAPLAAVAPAAPAPVALPTPSVVEHPTGWYQLRGDGATTPYTWVWIPRPPATAQPEPAPPPRAAEVPPPDAAAPRARHDRVYRWTDEAGVTTWTNRLDRVPRRFRDQAAASAEAD